MARLTSEQWRQALVDYESDPQASYESVGKRYGVSKQAVGRRAIAEGWSKVASTPALNAAANRAADGISSLEGRPNGQVDGVVDESRASKAPHPVSEVEAVNKRALVVGKHRDEVHSLDVLTKVARSLFGTAAQTTGSNEDRKAAWWRAKIAADAAKDNIAAAKMKQEMERKAWGLDIVVDPDQLRNMSDEDLELIAAGKLPRGFG